MVDASGERASVQVHKTDLALCQTPDGAASAPPPPGTAGTPVPAEGQLVRVDNPSHGGPCGSSVSGIAVASVTSMEADLANGRVVRGSVAYGRGFPYAAWWVTYPEGIAATLVFRDAAGQAVEEIAAPYPTASALRHPAPLRAATGESRGR